MKRLAIACVLLLGTMLYAAADNDTDTNIRKRPRGNSRS